MVSLFINKQSTSHGLHGAHGQAVLRLVEAMDAATDEEVVKELTTMLHQGVWEATEKKNLVVHNVVQVHMQSDQSLYKPI